MRRPSPIRVRHYGPGGTENGGGIGRFIGYLVDDVGPSHSVVDTRGRRWSNLESPMRMMFALGLMACDRLAAPDRMHHIHLAGRGSTLRKLVLAAAARWLGCHHILHLHDYDYEKDYSKRTPAMRSAVRRMFRGAGAVVVLGQRDRALATAVFGVDAARVGVLRNCVPDPKQRPLKTEGAPLIVFLGRLSKRKGVPELLDALAGAAMAELPWHAVLAGDGPIEEYRNKAMELGLGGRVEMPGWLGVEETTTLCRRADILVLPSHAEGMSLAVLEGLAHGLAVVTTPVGAHGEVIADGENGIFVPVGDADALTVALAALVRDQELRERLSQKARALYLSRFSMAAYARRLEEIYRMAATPRAGHVTSEGRPA